MTEEKKAKQGDKVQIDYIGQFEDGKIFDSSIEEEFKKSGLDQPGRKYEPMEVTIGSKQVIPGFENAIVDMKEGEEKKVTIPPEDAYGQPNPQMVAKVDSKPMKEQGQDPKPGMVVALMNAEGQKMAGVVKEVDGDDVTVDLNHPLAGKTLVFTIFLRKVL